MLVLSDMRILQDKKLVRRLDFMIIPWLTFLYLVSFLDRTNIGNAKVRWQAITCKQVA